MFTASIRSPPSTLCMSSYWSPSLLHPVPFSPLHLPLHTHSTSLSTLRSPQPRSPLPNPTPLSPPFPPMPPHHPQPCPPNSPSIGTPPSPLGSYISSSPPPSLSSLSLVGFHSCGE